MPPAEIKEAELRQALFDQFDIEVMSGLGQLSGKVLRIGTMGPLATDQSVDFLLTAIRSSISGIAAQTASRSLAQTAG